jgi:NTE family protein
MARNEKRKSASGRAAALRIGDGKRKAKQRAGADETKSKARAASAKRSPAELAGEYERVALALQGGGALGAYQAGVYQGLDEADIEPNALSGISIGAINLALIAGNPPGRRLERLKQFWETVSEPAFFPRLVDWQALANHAPDGSHARTVANLGAAMRAALEGQRGFFLPRPATAWLEFFNHGQYPRSYYDTGPLKETLGRLVDFGRLNSGECRVSVGAVNIRTGNFVFFESGKDRLTADHLMASAALPPGFPPVEIAGECYWDGGLVSNTPLGQILDAEPRQDTLAFQVDLWSAQGELPENLLDVLDRQKEILYSSRTRAVTSRITQTQRMRRALDALLAELPAGRRKSPAAMRAQREACRKVFNIVHLIYRSRHHELESKDYAFGPTSMREHWEAGLADMRATLADPRRLGKPSPEAGVVTHDVHRETVVRG